jgi:hypothetical protein
MRWTRKKHMDRDTRTKKGFLVFPKRIAEDTRWLEYAVWEEEYFFSPYAGGFWDVKRWMNT